MRFTQLKTLNTEYEEEMRCKGALSTILPDMPSFYLASLCQEGKGTAQMNMTSSARSGPQES
jgi:hypothetical protein